MVLMAASGTAHAAFQEFCTMPLTAAKANGGLGSGSGAQGQAIWEQNADPVGLRVTVQHNVAGASQIQVLTGLPNQSGGTLISNLGGNTANSFTYEFTTPELQAIVAAGGKWYLVVASAGGFALPGGAIRGNGEDCGLVSEGEPDGTVEGDGETLPEGYEDYSCSLNINASQVPGGSSSTRVGIATIEIATAHRADLRVRVLNGPDIGTDPPPYPTFALDIYSGAPGTTGTLVRHVSDNMYPAVIVGLSLKDTELYTTTPHYIQITENPPGGGSPSIIRANIVGCPFIAGEEPEGEGEGVIEGEGEATSEGEPLPPCLENPFGADLPVACSETLTGAAVVPATNSPYTGDVRVLGPVGEGANAFVIFVVRHNIPNATKIAIYDGAPGQAGSSRETYTAGLTCPFFLTKPVSFLDLIRIQRTYVQVDGATTDESLRADLICGNVFEGESDGEGVVEGTPEGGVEGTPEGDGEGTAPDSLPALANYLLQFFENHDSNHNGKLEITEIQVAFPPVTQQQLDGLDGDSNDEVFTSELHRWAGPVHLHNADVDGNRELSFAELIRLIQLYNAGSYSCQRPAGGTEDGFVPGSGGVTNGCLAHAADYEGDGDLSISLSELLRALQLYSFGSYAACPTSEDGFCIVQ